MIVSNQILTSHVWGENCKAWILMDTKDMSIKEESMPPGTSENNHYHKKSQQFFYILEGEAMVITDGERNLVRPSEGILVRAGIEHRLKNEQEGILRFLVISQPAVGEDRFEID